MALQFAMAIPLVINVAKVIGKDGLKAEWLKAYRSDESGAMAPDCNIPA